MFYKNRTLPDSKIYALTNIIGNDIFAFIMTNDDMTGPMDPSVTKDHQERNLRVLYEISCAMRTTLDLEHILYIILTGVTSHSGLSYNRAVLFLVNPANGTLECKMAIGPESGEHANKVWQYIEDTDQTLEDLIREDRIQQTHGRSSFYHSLRGITCDPAKDTTSLLAQAFRRGEPWHLTSDEVDSFADDPLLKKFITRELIIMPLRAHDAVNGLIIADNIYTQKPISDQDVRFFTMLSNQAGLAIENSRLYEMVVRQSQTDALTGLWNHGYFQKTLLTELEQSKKTKAPLTLALMDLDNFKALNDTCGHQHGDVVLKEVSKIFRESARDTDIICRYGGEEFAAIFTNTSSAAGYEIAERLRRRIDGYAFPSPSGVGTIHFTISIGLANFPMNAVDKDTLIQAADQALYRAKNAGKNQIYQA